MGSRPKTVIFWPFLAFEGRLVGLKDLIEVRVEDETCRTIHGTHLEGILSQKTWTGSAGVFIHDAFCCAADVACQAFLLGLTVSVVCQLYRDGWRHTHVYSLVVYICFGCHEKACVFW